MDSVKCFDDSLFDDNVEKSDVMLTLNNYIPKTCTSGWFNTIETVNTDEEQTAIAKFRADMCYSKGEYEEAIENYLTVIPLLETTNLTLKRDCVEGIIRCLFKLGKFNDALQWIDKLLDKSKSSSQMCSIWKLIVQVHQHNRDFKSEISTLHLLLQQNPLCFNLWLSLARAYSRLHCCCLPHCFDEDEGDSVSQIENSEYKTVLIIASCLSRAKILIDSTENNFRFLNFSRTRDLRLKIEQELSAFKLPKLFLFNARDFMCRDIKNDDEKSEFDDLTKKDDLNIPVVEPCDFEKLWFSWIDRYL